MDLLMIYNWAISNLLFHYSTKFEIKNPKFNYKKWTNA